MDVSFAAVMTRNVILIQDLNNRKQKSEDASCL
jgi:hypothetical protein